MNVTSNVRWVHVKYVSWHIHLNNKAVFCFNITLDIAATMTQLSTCAQRQSWIKIVEMVASFNIGLVTFIKCGPYFFLWRASPFLNYE